MQRTVVINLADCITSSLTKVAVFISFVRHSAIELSTSTVKSTGVHLMAAEASGTTAGMGILTSDASHKAGGTAYDVVK